MTRYRVIASVFSFIICVSLSVSGGYGQTVEKKQNWFQALELEYEVNAGINIGGASPMPLPAEIRHIDSYSPDLNLQLGASVTKWISRDKKWGVSVGARLETKGMETKATVKNYGMEILDNGNKLKGRWTGMVHTKYHTRQLVIPITGVYKINDKLRVNFGPYLGFAFDNDFNGYVYDGYLREGDPTGDKYVFEGDSRASYDFGANLRKFQWGLQGGISWLAYRHFVVNANLQWGLNGIFESSFKTVSFKMYPIYFNAGFGYIF